MNNSDTRKKADNYNLVNIYSALDEGTREIMEVCKKCGLPLDLCVCEELEKEETRIVVRLEMRRFRKPTTMIEGLNPKRTDLDKIAHQLKSKLACGGTAKEGYVLLQGDHRYTIKDHLVRLGFNESSIEVQ